MNRRGFVLAASAASASIVTARADAQQLVNVRVATTPIDAGAQPFFANSMGFFRAAGLNVTITTISNGSAIAAAVASGAVDIGQSNVVSIATAHERGIPFGLIAAGNLVVSRVHQAAAIVPNASPIHTAKDLTGKTLAVNGLGTIPHVGARAWVDQSGGDSNAVKYTEIPFTAMAVALDAGRIDCAFVSEPQLDDALASKHFRVIGYPYDAISKQFLLGGWFTTLAWAKANPEAVRAFAAAMRTTSRWANANQAASGKILQSETGIVVTPQTTRVQFSDALDPNQIQPVLDASAHYGVLKSSFPASEIILTL
jgi:NitT/TauT family transport system substrate-binding protein